MNGNDREFIVRNVAHARVRPRAFPRGRERFGRASAAAWLQPGVVALGLCLVALLGAAWVSTTVFDRLPHVEDDVAFLFQAKTLASGQLLARAPLMPEFFEIPFVIVRDGHWFGKYPPGYPLVLALGVLSGHTWLLNPVVGAFAAGLVYLAGRRLYGPSTGLLAAALLVASPFFLLQSGSFMSHTVALFWAMLFLLLFERTWRTGSRLSAVAAGGVIGLLFISRPLTAVGIGLPFVAWVALDTLVDWRRIRVYLPVALVFLPFVAAMLGYNRLTTGDPLTFAYELWWPYDKIGFGPGVGYTDGHSLADAKFFMRLNLTALSDYLYGWPRGTSAVPVLAGVLLAVAGLMWRGVALVRARRAASRAGQPVPTAMSAREVVPETWDMLLFGVAFSLIMVHIAYWTPGQMYGPRYYFEAIGALALLSARGILGLAGLLSLPLRAALPRLPQPRLWTTIPALLLVGALVLWNFNTFAPARFREFTDWYNINADGVRRVESANLSHALVFVEREEWTDYAPFFVQNSPQLDDDVLYAVDHGEHNRALMALYPDRAYYRYADGQLTPLP